MLFDWNFRKKPDDAGAAEKARLAEKRKNDDFYAEISSAVTDLGNVGLTWTPGAVALSHAGYDTFEVQLSKSNVRPGTFVEHYPTSFITDNIPSVDQINDAVLAAVANGAPMVLEGVVDNVHGLPQNVAAIFDPNGKNGRG